MSFINCDYGAFDESALNESQIDNINEQLLVEECLGFNEEQLNAFLESDLCQTLVTEGKMRKNTILILGKSADYNRRNKLIAFNMAKEAHDPDWEKLRKNRIIERKLIGNIMRKWGNKAKKATRVQQKDWIKNRMPANFGKFGGADRVSQ